MRKKANGFTLFELLIALAIFGIMTVIAILPGKEMLTGFVQKSSMNDLLRSIAFARLEAITQNEVVRICASNDGENCSSSQKWEEGWIVYVDKSGKSTRTENDPVIRIYPQIKNLTIRKNGGEKTVKFNPSGWVGLNRSLYICTEKQEPLKRLVIIHSGRVRTANDGIQCKA